jgi:hypothetical protein
MRNNLESEFAEEVLSSGGLLIGLRGVGLVLLLKQLLDCLAGIHTVLLCQTVLIDQLLQFEVD